MSIVKTLPWISLVLVMFSYATLGWALSETEAPLYLWITIILAVLVLVGSLTIPESAISKYFHLLLQSNIRSFAVAAFGAFLFFIMLAWFRIFLDTLLIISVGILARIDCQTAGYKQGKAFLITLIFSLAGLALGKVLYLAFYQP